MKFIKDLISNRSFISQFWFPSCVIPQELSPITHIPLIERPGKCKQYFYENHQFENMKTEYERHKKRRAREMTGWRIFNQLCTSKAKLCL